MLKNMIRRIGLSFARFLCKYRGKSFIDAIELNIDSFHRFMNNLDFDMNRNGESRVLRIMSGSNMHCIFDVGSNVGEYAEIASNLNPQAMIHTFEIVPSTHKELLNNLNGLKNIIPNNVGLSNIAGPIKIHIGDASSMSTSCNFEGNPAIEGYYTNSIECKTIRAFDYMTDAKIKAVDFVKIDVEGMDLKVIQGFAEKLKCVRALQFEYGIWNIISHDLLIDFYSLLKQHGFVIGKIFPNQVKFFEYHFNMENFHGSNYLAVRGDETNLIEKMKAFGG